MLDNPLSNVIEVMFFLQSIVLRELEDTKEYLFEVYFCQQKKFPFSCLISNNKSTTD